MPSIILTSLEAYVNSISNHTRPFMNPEPLLAALVLNILTYI